MSSLDSLARCDLLPEQLRLEAAALAAEAMSQLYQSFIDEAVPMLQTEFLVEGSELGDARCLVADSSVEGMVAAYPSAEYQGRQTVSLHHALGQLGRPASAQLVRQLRTIAAQVPKEAPEGEYIARFAVPASVRGSGAADRLMQSFLADHRKSSLHVRADNGRAIAFYRRHGFARRAATDHFILMQRD